MSFYTFSSGINTSFSSQLNSNFNNHNLSLAGFVYQSLLQDIADSKTPNYTRQYFCAEKFSDSNGYRDTLDITNTDSYYFSTNKYYTTTTQLQSSNDTTSQLTDGSRSWVTTTNAFDYNDETSDATTTTNTTNIDMGLGKTFASARFISKVRIKANQTWSTNGTKTISLESYNGSAWNNEATLITEGGTTSTTYDDTYHLNKSVQGLRIRFTGSLSSVNKTAYLFTLNYFGNTTNSQYVETNTIMQLPINAKGLLLFADYLLTSNQSLVIDKISYDGGSSWAMTNVNKAPGEVVVFSGTLSSSLALQFKLSSSLITEKPEFYGFGISLII